MRRSSTDWKLIDLPQDSEEDPPINGLHETYGQTPELTRSSSKTAFSKGSVLTRFDLLTADEQEAACESRQPREPTEPPQPRAPPDSGELKSLSEPKKQPTYPGKEHQAVNRRTQGRRRVWVAERLALYAEVG